MTMSRSGKQKYPSELAGFRTALDMKRKRSASEWPPPEVEAVLKASPHLRPCEPKYGRIPYDEFPKHIVNDRCLRCRAFFFQLDKELRMMSYLRDHKN
jgi:hypothetical protein